MVALFDEASGARITDAKLTVSVGELGMGMERRALESMPFGSAVTFGNYFSMRRAGVYRIRVDIERPKAPKAASVNFDYRHGDQ